MCESSCMHVMATNHTKQMLLQTHTVCKIQYVTQIEKDYLNLKIDTKVCCPSVNQDSERHLYL
jgi:hypothetical protein